MNKWIASAVVASTFAVAAPAMAATNIPMTGTADVQFGTFSKTFVTTGTGFVDDYTFLVPAAGLVSGTISTISVVTTAGVTLTDFILNGISAAPTYNAVTNTYSATVSGVATIANPQTLTLKYNVTTAGAYQGNVSWAKSAVPEPATWALMILGFGVVGYAMRRRPAVRFAQAI